MLKATVGPLHRQAPVLRNDDNKVVRMNVRVGSEVRETYRVPEVRGLGHMAEQADLDDPRQHLD